MKDLIPWFHIVIAVSVYIVIALLASSIIRKKGKNLKEVEGRTSPFILFIGAAANLFVLAVIILLLIYVDGRSIHSLGIVLTDKDLIFSFAALMISIVIALGFVAVLDLSHSKTKINIQKPVKNISQTLRMFEGLGVLFIVAAQEETLFRGYITLNLISYGPVLIIIVTTIIFTAIHFLTNKVTSYQVINWFLGGAILSYAYLISGSIWAVIILHFAMDAVNMLLFNITGQFSVYTFLPSLSNKRRFIYRLSLTFATLIILIAIYGLTNFHNFQ